MRLDTKFRKLPIRFDAERLAWEVSRFAEDDWQGHPQGHPGNSALALIAAHGDPDDDAARGPMRPTPHLQRCPYIRQVLAALGSVLGRTRLMRIDGQGEATAHVDTNYYWLQRVRVHVPVITPPEVRFVCGGRSVHMAAGETWIFDTWRLHNVLNPAARARIHLVADTVGSSAFWELAARGEPPAGDGDSPRPMSAAGTAPVPYVPGHEPELETELINVPVVMSPWEQQCLIVPILEDLAQAEPAASGASVDLKALLERFRRDWRSAWAAHGDGASGWLSFRRLLRRLDGQLESLEGRLRLPNDLDVVEALRQAVVRPALDPERTAEEPRGPRDPQPPTTVGPEPRQPAIGVGVGGAPSSGCPAAPWPRTADRFDRPVFIVSAPRAGSTMLFEALARAPGFWTVGGESHEVFESLPALRPADRGFDSNRLTAADADPTTADALRGRFVALLRDAEGRLLPSDAPTLRMLEKTPKNALRIPFLDAVFPDALFIYLYREPRENLSSIMEAWRSGRFVTYTDLPGWDGPPWSLLLIPGWRELSSRPPAEVAAAQWAAAQSAILDDLARLAPGRWCTITYDALVADPPGQIERLCAFAGVPRDPRPTGPLPWSRYTLTPPDSDKWRKNADALEAVLPRVAEVAARARRAVADDPSRRADAACPTDPVDPPAPRPRAPEPGPGPVVADDDGAG